MRKLLIPIVTLAMIMLPAAANAEQCRSQTTGKFAKCGSAGAVLDSQYVAKAKAKPKKSAATTPAKAGPTSTATRPGLMSLLKPKAKPTAAPSATPTAKAARCKTAKGKFVKCGTPGAKPA